MYVEAPRIELAASARILVNGGAGGTKDNIAIRNETTAATAGACESTNCAPGGNGAVLNVAPTAGSTLTYDPDGELHAGAGGGGGGLGRVRVNTAPDAFIGDQALVNGALTTGTISL